MRTPICDRLGIERVLAEHGIPPRPDDAAHQQGILDGHAAHRSSRARSRALGGSPAGQIVGTMAKVRTAKEVVYDIVDESVETNRRLCAGT